MKIPLNIHNIPVINKEKKMNITDVRIRLFKKDEGKLRAVASIIIDNEFVVHDIKVIEGNDGYFIVMPSRKAPDGEFRDIAHPLKSEVREFIKQKILAAYDKAKLENEAQNVAASGVIADKSAC
jgi:Uncharacterized protein, involved in the regulation of septum location